MMLVKLLKYDFRAMWKQLSLVWGAALALALVNRFTWNSDGETASALLTMALFAVLVAMFVIAIAFIIQRFSGGLLGDEGYLMNTLPVRSWQLVASKLICALAVCLASGVVAFLTPFVMTPINWLEFLDLQAWWEIFRAIARHPDAVVLIAEFFVLLLSSLTINIAALYLAMSVGHLFSRHRRLISVAAFIGLYILLSSIYSRFFSLHIVQQLMSAATENIYGSMLTAIAIMLVPALVFLAVTSWILENKLNLE